MSRQSSYKTWSQMESVESQSLARKRSKSKNNISCVAELKNTNQLKLAIKSTRIVVVKAEADWCEPCRVLRPRYEELAEKAQQTTQFAFFTDDIDQPDSYHVSKVTAVPTFFVYIDGNIEPKKIFTGDFEQLETLINNIIERIEQDKANESDETQEQSKQTVSNDRVSNDRVSNDRVSNDRVSNDRVSNDRVSNDTEQISWINN